LSNILCSFKGCKNKAIAKGLCSGHWKQQRFGKKLKRLRNTDTLEQRFLDRVKKGKKDDDCWIWKGGMSGNGYKKGYGYGQLSFHQKIEMAHRISYKLYVGKIPPNMEIDHMCGNSMCVNPKHLRPLEKKENIQTMRYHMYLKKEVNRLRKIVINLGGDPDADVPSV